MITVPDYTQKLLPATATATRNNGHNGNGHHAPNSHRRHPAPPQADALDLAPHSVEAEEALLGATLMHPATLYDTMRLLSPDDFFILRHGWIWDALSGLHRAESPIDTRILAEELRCKGRLDAIGGETYLRMLPTLVPTALHANVYAHIVKRAAIRRQLLGAAGQIAQLAHDESHDVYQVLDLAQGILGQVTQECRMETGTATDLAQLASEFYDLLESWKLGTQERGLPTPWPDYNRLTGGLLNTDLIVVGAVTSMGKSAWMIQCALHLAKQGKRVGFYTNEMSKQQITARLFALEAGISTHQSRLASLDDADWNQFVKAANTLSLLPITIDDIRGCTPLQVKDRARREAQTSGLDVVFVDYLHNFPDLGDDERNEIFLHNAVLTLRNLAGELNIPVVLASQLNGDVEKRANHRPRSGDLRGSKAISQTADVIVFLHRDGYWKAMAGEAHKPAHNLTDIIVSKQRNGPTGDVPVIWQADTTSFESAAQKHQLEKEPVGEHWTTDG